MHFELTPTIDFVGTLAYLDAEIEVPLLGGAVSEDGYGIGVGVRGALENNFEWEAGIDYADVGESGTSFGLDGRYYFTDTIAVGAGVEFDDDATVYAIGMRVEFGQ